MEWDVFPRGVLLGLSIAAPVGPIGLLTIRRTISDGFRMGFATGLGAATADTMYGIVAAFGLTAVMSALTERANEIRFIGGMMLLVIGLRGLVNIVRARAGSEAVRVDAVRSPLSSYVQTVGLTLTNPMTILAFVAMFAGVGIGDDPGIEDAFKLVIGVAIGSALWWLFLAGAVAHIRHKLSVNAVRLINVGSSVIITGFGIAALAATAL